jgi:hypothetical protein
MSFRLLALPGEIRNIVYAHIDEDDTTFFSTAPPTGTVRLPSIAHVPALRGEFLHDYVGRRALVIELHDRAAREQTRAYLATFADAVLDNTFAFSILISDVRGLGRGNFHSLIFDLAGSNRRSFGGN